MNSNRNNIFNKGFFKVYEWNQILRKDRLHLDTSF